MPENLTEIAVNPGVNKSALATGRAVRPDFIGPRAAEIWDSIIASLPAHFYGAADAAPLAAFCTAAALHRKAAVALGNESAVRTGRAGRLVVNPWVRILDRQSRLLAALSSRLGLDPASRSSLVLPSLGGGKR